MILRHSEKETENKLSSQLYHYSYQISNKAGIWRRSDCVQIIWVFYYLMSGNPASLCSTGPVSITVVMKAENYSDDCDENYKYEELSINEDAISLGSEDFNTLLKCLKVEEKEKISSASSVIFCFIVSYLTEPQDVSESPEASVKEIPETVDDFICNFLAQMKMRKTLNAFQTECNSSENTDILKPFLDNYHHIIGYEMEQKGMVSNATPFLLPDVYTSILQLESQIKLLEKDSAAFKKVALKAKEAYLKLQKQRDFHRMNHHRIVQERDNLMNDIRRLKKHYSAFEPTLKEFKERYESAMKHKMLTKIELERTQTHCEELTRTIKNLDIKHKPEKRISEPYITTHPCGKGRVILDEKGMGPTQRKLAEEREKSFTRSFTRELKKDSKFPSDRRINPLLLMNKTLSSYPIRAGGFKLTKTYIGHKDAISSVCLQPKSKLLATASDDKTWKLWSMPAGELIVTGEGHTEWVADCAFNDDGNHLATCGGDKTVKIWDFSHYKCQHTFKEHQLGGLQVIFLVGEENEVKDISLELFLALDWRFCSFIFQRQYWESMGFEQGLCGQTFYGHTAGVNHAVINQKGDTVASCDTQGIVKLWDTRTVAPMITFEAGSFSANKLAFDYTSSVVAIACDDHTVKIYEIASGQLVSLIGHDDAVQCVEFECSGQYLVSGGSDGTARFWS
ncbi:sperm-associated antigen 16 protein-like [Octopus vulgaris]|uniref:Sperm-associated antigen 16 protein-like n=1 Tax=Octopus vulgaris TaxID=6645 RepID=A0AA36AI41_OCTVU|nr:sperm-associated antigen 16 protein-like [Octopus vulgaris]